MKPNMPLLFLALVMSLTLFCIVQSSTDRLITQTNKLIENCQKP